MVKGKLVSRCSVCLAIELNGGMISAGNFENMGNERYEYTDGILSYKCMKSFYGSDMANSIYSKSDKMKLTCLNWRENF